MANWVFLLALCALSKTVVSVPTFRSIRSELPEIQAMEYLSRFGYLDSKFNNPTLGAQISADVLQNAVMEFQSFAGLKQTGTLDTETMDRMSQPRCEGKDNVRSDSSAPKKRYPSAGSRWTLKELTYRVTKYPRKLPPSDVDRELARAFKLWADKTDFSFTNRPSRIADIEIRFELSDHGDVFPFDGPYGTFGQAYIPERGGDAHFDEAETWTVRYEKGTNLFQVAAHELGHSLGLFHSNVISSVMAPFYPGYKPNFQLDDDDVQAIQSLYPTKVAGTVPRNVMTTINPVVTPTLNATWPTTPSTTLPTTTPTTTTTASPTTLPITTPTTTPRTPSTTLPKTPPITTPTTSLTTLPTTTPTTRPTTLPAAPESSDLCPDGKVDTIFSAPDGNVIVFKGDKYYKVNDFGIVDGYPRSIAQDWGGLPANIDAAFTWKTGHTYFFKGSNYWRFTNLTRNAGYPKDTSEIFPGFPKSVDIAFAWSDGYAYIFNGTKYWRFDPSSSPPIDDKLWPRDISLWEGLPYNLDAAFQDSNGMTYFFKDGKYWRYNDQSNKVDEANPPYPRPSGPWWFGC